MDYLFLLCELAAAFAGFTALVAVLRPERDSGTAELGRVRLQMMLELSLLTIGAGLLPFLLVSFGLTEEAANRVAAVVMLPLFTVLYLSQVRRGFRARVQSLPGYSLLYARFIAALGVLCLVTLLVAALGVGDSRGWYPVGVTALLVVAGLQFFRTATATLRSPE